MSANALKTVDPLPLQRQDAGQIMADVITKGDLSKLSDEQRARYYLETCKSLGINPLVKPFDYITLNGKMTLYATRTATDQLRSINGVSIKIVDRRTEHDLHIVVAQAQVGSRLDESTGAVNIAGLKGDALANAYMKAETKAKRRVTLSICGLGWMDESETTTVPGARIVPVDPETGEILNSIPETVDVLDLEPTQPEPQEKPAKERKDEYRLKENKRYHAVCADVGLSDAATALFAHAVGKRDSRSELSGQELHDLADMAEGELQRMPDGSVNPFVELANAIAVATQPDELTTLASKMVDRDLMVPWLVEFGRRRRQEISNS